MSTIISRLPSPKRVHRRRRPEEQHFFLSNVSWESYVAIGNALENRAGLRITYDQGNLEFMTTSGEHEFHKKWFGRFVETIAEELERPMCPRGGMTFQREDLEKGLEGDECYWIVHEARMRRERRWDPETDPPPDLFLEIEVSRSVVNRLAICASLRIPEVWTYNGKRIRVRRLRADGKYEVCATSQFFPEIPIAEIARFLDMDTTPDYATAVREFRAWVRQILGKPPIT
jgi:Uma2 family endonuclease